MSSEYDYYAFRDQFKALLYRDVSELLLRALGLSRLQGSGHFLHIK